MRIGTLVLAAIACTLVCACASTETFIRPGGTFLHPFLWFLEKTPCSADCSVTVTVKENSSDKTCKPEYVLPIEVTGNNGVRTITWTVGAGYKFSDQSYKFALFVKVDPQGKFKSAQVPGGGKTLVLKFEHNKNEGDPQKIYDYALTVQRDDGSFCTTLDPWLIS
jgi:hypothetical protein